MEVVEALKDISQIEAMKKYLKEHSQRDYLLFVIGINTGLKITELLSMKFEEVLNEDGTVKEFYSLPVKDEKFKQDIYLNTKVKEALLEYVQSIDVKRENYVFQSNKTKIQLHVNKRIVSFIMLLKRLGLLVKSEQTQ